MPRTAIAPKLLGWALAADLALIIVFVLIGRGSHDEGFSVAGSLTTAWPFVAGLALGWVVTRAWRAPWGLVSPGVVIWASTVLVGMVLRAISGQGTAVSFVIVTALVLALFLLGWRAIATAVLRRRGRRAAA